MAETSQKVVLITGCSSGIGLSTAVLLAKDAERRFKVYATMRNLVKKADLETEGRDVLDKSLFIRELDVTSEDQISRVLDDIFKEDGKIDILVNNAGIGCARPSEFDTLDNIRPIFATNTFGPMLLTKSLLPHWKKRNSGHAILISSIVGILGFGYSSSYSASKFAIEGYYESLAQECVKFDIKFSIVEPGPVASKFHDNASVSAISGYLDKIDMLSRETMKTMKKAWAEIVPGTGQTSEEIGQSILEVITAERPNFRYLTNKAFVPLVQAKYCDIYGNAGINAVKKMFQGKEA